MSDKYKIDSHKLMFHTKRVSDWLNGDDIYPIYLEVGVCGKCNHRCIFCAFDYLNYKGAIIEKDVLLGFLSEAAKLGVKSVMYAGEGEPLMHHTFLIDSLESKASAHQSYIHYYWIIS